jgi:ssDNA-specific exonuclease RecJ
MAILTSLVGFGHLVQSFTSCQLVEQIAVLLDAPYSTEQPTYHLRRLKRKRLILKMAHSHRYQLTDLGRRVAVLFQNLRASPGSGLIVLAGFP